MKDPDLTSYLEYNRDVNIVITAFYYDWCRIGEYKALISYKQYRNFKTGRVIRAESVYHTVLRGLAEIISGLQFSEVRLCVISAISLNGDDIRNRRYAGQIRELHQMAKEQGNTLTIMTDGDLAEDRPLRILCFGDSNTYGFDPRSFWGARYPAESRWVDILGGYTGMHLINEGENGRGIPEGASEYKRFNAMLDKSEADYLIVMLGDNDLLQGASTEKAAARMERFLTQITGIERQHIILPGLPPKRLGAWVPDESLIARVKALSLAYEEMARKLGIRFVDTSRWDIDLCYDGVHFTEKGHKAFAGKMAEIIIGLRIKVPDRTP